MPPRQPCRQPPPPPPPSPSFGSARAPLPLRSWPVRGFARRHRWSLAIQLCVNEIRVQPPVPKASRSQEHVAGPGSGGGCEVPRENAGGVAIESPRYVLSLALAGRRQVQDVAVLLGRVAAAGGVKASKVAVAANTVAANMRACSACVVVGTARQSVEDFATRPPPRPPWDYGRRF